MRRALLLTVPLAALLVLAAVSASATGAASTMTPTVVPLTMVGSTSFTPSGGGPGGPVVDTAEIDQATNGDTDSGDGEDFGEGVNRTLPGAVTGQGQARQLEQEGEVESRVGNALPGSEPLRPAVRQRRQPVLGRAARPGALRRQRLHLRGGQRRRPGLHDLRRAGDAASST